MNASNISLYYGYIYRHYLNLLFCGIDPVDQYYPFSDDSEFRVVCIGICFELHGNGCPIFELRTFLESSPDKSSRLFVHYNDFFETVQNLYKI